METHASLVSSKPSYSSYLVQDEIFQQAFIHKVMENQLGQWLTRTELDTLCEWKSTWFGQASWGGTILI